VQNIRSGAGFAEIRIEAVDGMIGRSDINDAVDMTLDMGPIAAALRETGGDKRDVVAAALREAYAPFVGPDGVRLGAAVWIAQASAP
jgi:hypothetical protein